MVVLAELVAICVAVALASLFASTAPSAIFAVVTAPDAILAVVTLLALGSFIFTVDPIVTMKKSAPLEGAAENIMSPPSIAKPSLGWLVPLLGF